MNRRKLVVSLVAVCTAMSFSRALAQTPTSSPSAARESLVDFKTPLVEMVTVSYYRGPAPRDTYIRPVLGYILFTFASKDNASETFTTLPEQVKARSKQSEFQAHRWTQEISIGQVGDERLGFYNQEFEMIEGLVLQGKNIAHFTLSAADAVATYEESILPILQDRKSLEIELGDLPVGWLAEFTDRHVTDLFLEPD